MTPKTLPLLDHLRELRKRLMISVSVILLAFIPAFAFYADILPHLIAPFNHLASTDYGLIITTLFEGFAMKVKVSFLVALIATTPLHLFLALRFIFPGLRDKERRWVGIALLTGLLLAFLSLYLGYFYLLPFSINFLTTHEFIPKDVGVLLHFGDNLVTILKFLFMGAIAFQFPILLLLLMAFGILTRKQVMGGTRYAVVMIFILSALVTPPDVISQLCFSVPLLLLFILTLLVAKLFKFGEDPTC